MATLTMNLTKFIECERQHPIETVETIKNLNGALYTAA